MKLYEAITRYGEFMVAQGVRDVSVERFIGDLRRLCMTLWNPEVEELTDRDFLNYRRLMQQHGYKHNGISKVFDDIRHFAKYAQKQGWLRFDYELIPLVKKEYSRPRVWEEVHYRKILAYIDDEFKNLYCQKASNRRNKAIIAMLYDSGMRCGELCLMNEKDTNTEDMKATIHCEKRRTKAPFREIYWTKETNGFLEEWLEYREELKQESPENVEPLFFSVQGGHHGRLSNTHIGTIMRRYCRKIGIPVCNPHGARHHFAVDLTMKNCSLPMLSEMLGHTTFDATKVYARLVNKQTEEVYNRFNRNG